MPPRKTKVVDDEDIDDSNFVRRSTRPRKQVAPLGFDSSTKSKKPASETRVTRKRKGKEESESESEDEVIEDSSSSSGEEEEKPTKKTRGRRKSPRRKSPVPKSKYVEPDEDEFDSEVSSASDSDEVEEESPKDAGKLIDLIVARRPRASAPLTASQNDAKKKSPKKSYVNWEYLVKAKNVAYLHAKWMLPEDLIQEFSNGKNRLTKFIREKVDEQEEARRERDNSNQYLFPPDYLLVDRIVDIEESDDDKEPTMLYVKWKSLGYDDCTWENKDDLLALVPNAKEKLELYERINSEEFFEQQKQPTPTRPKAKDDDSEDLAIPYKDLPRKDDDDESDKDDEDEEEEEDDSDNEKDDKKKKEKSKKSETKKNEDESQNIDIMEIDEEEPVDDGKPHRYRLKDYQETGFRWLVHCWYNRRSSILADEMGLGKTIQSAMMLQYLYREQGINGPFLIVAPMSTIEQWKRELELWTDLNVIILHGSADGRNLIFEKEFHFDGYSKRGATVYKVQAVITTYEVVMIESTRLKNIPWQYVIIDEGHKLKNSASKLFQTLTKYTARHKLILTGTPLQNGIKELWTLMNYLEPKKFDNVQDFLDEFGELRNTEQVAKLHKRLGPYMLRRTKEDVDASIPKKEETLVEIELSNTQKPYYKAIFDRNRSFLTKNAAKASLMNVMMQLRKCCNHPYLIRDAEDSITKDIHITHRRKDEEVKDEALFKRLVSSSSKFVFMDKLLTRLREKKQRVLIFSQMVKLLDILEDYMDYKGYPFVRLDGSIKRSDRQAAIDKFSNPDVDMFVFLLGTRAGGLGINLTIASTVIIFDSDWNPMNDLQAQARCHRIGQVNTVKVYRLITKNTYEKHMFNIASKKLGLDKVVMGRKAEEDNEGEEIVKGMSKDDIEKVLKYGAYALFSNNEKETNEEKEMDIDEILEHSTTVAYKSDPTNELSSFSKATFATEEENDGIDWDDEHFWDKLLPSFKTGNKISEILKNDVASLDKAEVRNQIMEDLKVLWDDAKFQEEHKSEFSTYDPIAQVAHILKKLNNVIEKFSEEHRKQIHDWSTVVEKPRLRSTRSSRRGADSDEEEPKKVQPQRGAKAAAAKEAKKPNEWAKAQRDRFKTALFQYGYGRWSDISTAAKLDSTKHVDEVQAFGENFVKQFLNEVETKEDEEEKEKKVVAAKTFYSVVIEDLNAKMLKKIKKGTELKEVSKESDITMEMEGKSFIAGELFQVKIKGSHDNLHLLIKYTDESSSSTSYIVRYIPVEKDTVDVYAPGFFDGEYKMQLVSVETADNTTTVNVLDELEFIVCPNPLLQDSEMNACKMWLNKLFLLRDLILVNENYDIAKEKIPSLTIKDPSSWWKSSDDRKLLTGIYKIGYGKYKELQEDKEYEWDTKSIESRTKSKDEKENAFPSGPALNKRLLKLTQEIIKRMERVEKREKDGKTEKKKDKENVDPEKKKVKQMKLDGKPSEEDDKKKKKSSDDKKKKSEDDEKKKKKKEDSDEKKKKEKKKSDDSDDKKKKKDDKEKKKRKKDSDDKDKKEKKEKKAKKEKKSKEEKKAADDKKPSPNPLSKRRKLVQPGLEIFLKKSNDEIVPV